MLGDILGIVKPVDVVDILLYLLSETYRLDAEISEALSLGIDYQVLRLSCHELRCEPCSEELSVEGLIPLVVIVLIGVFQFIDSCVGLDSCLIEELFIDLFISIGVGSSKLISLTLSLFHLNTVENGKSYVVDEDWLDVSVHALG